MITAQWPVNAIGNAEPIDINGDGHLDLVFSVSEFSDLGPVITVAINRVTVCSIPISGWIPIWVRIHSLATSIMP